MAALVCSWPAAAAAVPCPVSGGEDAVLEDIVVQPSQGRAFRVGVAGPGITALIGSKPSSVARIQVRAALAFDGTRRDVVYTLKTPWTAAGGLVRLQRGARFLASHARGEVVVGAAVLVLPDDTEPGDEVEPDESVGAIELPCAALTLDAIEPAAEPAVTTPDPQGFWKPRGTSVRIALRAQPRWDAPRVWLRRHVPDPEVDVVFEQTGENGEWVELLRSDAMGGLRPTIELRGWVHKSELQRVHQFDGLWSSSCGYRRHPTRSYRSPSAGRPLPPYYAGPATIAPGTPVYREPGRGRWATVHARDGFRVVYRYGEDWADIREIPGLEIVETTDRGLYAPSAYVPVSSVSPVQSSSQP